LSKEIYSEEKKVFLTESPNQQFPLLLNFDSWRNFDSFPLCFLRCYAVCEAHVIQRQSYFVCRVGNQVCIKQSPVCNAAAHFAPILQLSPALPVMNRRPQFSAGTICVGKWFIV